jgi:hypothetical protein
MNSEYIPYILWGIALSGILILLGYFGYRRHKWKSLPFGFRPRSCGPATIGAFYDLLNEDQHQISRILPSPMDTGVEWLRYASLRATGSDDCQRMCSERSHMKALRFAYKKFSKLVVIMISYLPSLLWASLAATLQALPATPHPPGFRPRGSDRLRRTLAENAPSRTKTGK